MTALIPTFEYDIFISYRHNDNLDGWVTDFVQNLEKELRSTLKDSVTIYFDKNPHDGLLETHHVDKSLEGKLKCLIFIPIISQTYCDTKSFAWQHEFVAFNKLAKEDQFGRDIKLTNGNVASRILPIKIHDIDVEDKTTIENEIGGVLRAIEFIYKEAGVNRPLKSTDSKSDNQNKTDYRNQVNKVANAIKEIISSLKNPITSTQRATVSEVPKSKKSTNTKSLLVISASIILLAVAGYFFYPKPFRPIKEESEALDKSIAVLPFSDLSANGDQEYLGDGIAEEIINVLAQSQDLKVIARSSSFQFKGKNEDLRTIGKILGVATILEGSVRKYKDQVRITAQLINVKDGSHYWSKNFNQNTDNIFVIQDGIAASVAEALKITLLEGETTQRVQKWDDEAQRLYQQGRYFYDRTGPDDAFKANELLKRSVEIDSNQSISHLYLAVSYGNLAPLQKSAADANSLREKQKSYLEKALILDPNLSSARAIKALLYAWDHKFIDAVREIELALSNGSTSPMTLRTAARLYVDWGEPEKAIEYAKKAMELDPLQTRSLLFASETYFYAHNYSGARAILDKALSIDPSNALYRLLLWTSLKEKKVDEASEIIKYIKDPNSRIYDSLLVSTFVGNKSRTHQLAFENQNFDSYEKAVLYAIAQNPDEAIKYLEVAFHERNLLMVHLATDPFLDPIRMDTRFKKLLEMMNYPKLK